MRADDPLSRKAGAYAFNVRRAGLSKLNSVVHDGLDIVLGDPVVRTAS